MRITLVKTHPLSLWLAVLLAGYALSGRAQDLGSALNAPNLTWSTSGTSGGGRWTAQWSTTHDGSAAAVSSFLSSSSATSTLQTTVTGPGILTFWWTNGSRSNLLSFYVGTNRVATLTNAAWQQQTAYVDAASQTTLSWIYSSGPAVDFTPQARGYVDEVSYTPGPLVPTITSQPKTRSQVLGFPITFTVLAGGAPPLSYQWQFNDAALAGATNSSLTITNPVASDAGSYAVLVTNTFGSVLSSNAYLEFGELTAWGATNFDVTIVPLGATNLLAIGAGDYYGLMLRRDGSVAAWGKNAYGQCQVPADLTNAIAISAGSLHCLALKADRTVVAWGYNIYNQATVPATLTNVIAVAAGALHSLALCGDGTVAAWGGNVYNSFTETNVPPGLSNVVAIAANRFSLALKVDGTVVTWGSNAPPVPTNLSNVVAIAAGEMHALALLANGTVSAWGANFAGQTSVPAGLSNVVAIAARSTHNLALCADGKVVGWGLNSPIEPNVPAFLSNVVAVSCGAAHDLAIVGQPPGINMVPITGRSVNDGQFVLSVDSQSGHVYALQYTSSLADGSWSALPLAAGTGKPLAFTNAITGEQRFFRVLRW